jgi:hypothetical protein
MVRHYDGSRSSGQPQQPVEDGLCDCPEPDIEHIPFFDTYQCRKCWRKVVVQWPDT